MRAGVLQLSRWGLLDRVVAAGTPPVRRTTFHYAGAEPVVVSIRPSPGVDALYAPRRQLLDPIIVDAAAEAGVARAARRHGDRTAPRRRRPGRRGRARPVRAARSTSGPRYGRRRRHPIDRRPRGRRARRTAGSTAASGVLYRYFAGLHADGYEWGYARRAAAGLIPTNDGLTCVFVGTSRTGCARCGGAASSARSPRCSRPRRPPSPSGSRGATPVGTVARLGRRARASSVGPTGRAGRWSGTRATSRTRSPPTGSPTRCATPSWWPTSSWRR